MGRPVVPAILGHKCVKWAGRAPEDVLESEMKAAQLLPLGSAPPWFPALPSPLTAFFLVLQPEPQPGDLIEIFRPFYRHWAVYVGGGYVVHLAPSSKGTQGLHRAEAGSRGDGGAVGNRGPQYSSCSPTGSWFLSATRRSLGVGPWFSNSAPWNPRGVQRD